MTNNLKILEEKITALNNLAVERLKNWNPTYSEKMEIYSESLKAISGNDLSQPSAVRDITNKVILNDEYISLSREIFSIVSQLDNAEYLKYIDLNYGLMSSSTSFMTNKLTSIIKEIHMTSSFYNLNTTTANNREYNEDDYN